MWKQYNLFPYFLNIFVHSSFLIKIRFNFTQVLISCQIYSFMEITAIAVTSNKYRIGFSKKHLLVTNMCLFVTNICLFITNICLFDTNMCLFVTNMCLFATNMCLYVTNMCLFVKICVCLLQICVCLLGFVFVCY